MKNSKKNKSIKSLKRTRSIRSRSFFRSRMASKTNTISKSHLKISSDHWAFLIANWSNERSFPYSFRQNRQYNDSETIEAFHDHTYEDFGSLRKSPLLFYRSAQEILSHTRYSIQSSFYTSQDRARKESIGLFKSSNQKTRSNNRKSDNRLLPLTYTNLPHWHRSLSWRELHIP